MAHSHKKNFPLRALLLLLLLVALVGGGDIAQAQAWRFRPGEEVGEEPLHAYGVAAFFSQEPLPDSVFTLMQGRSYKANCPIPRDSLRYIRCLHKDLEGRSIVGEMVVNVRIAECVLRIFRQLYDNGYPIEKMRLIDHYDASDEASMRDNNSSGFNFRSVAGSKKPSKHGRGLAIDINPLYNPYFRYTPDRRAVRPETVRPATATRYIDRTASFPYKIVRGDVCHRLFIAHGFVWGGSWRSCKDYQHFEWP